ncbi:hypothetical protein [Actinomadura decatromicini]|uniref:Uncharacterized protein n=1 Tax=Actinomadura decatromicini TaxID=2604572 RepID=A0A5D3FNU7_9ACTN|nr:hypothetical protein [Actinomadura decatromicini]TYK50477.1 hypothetical protein FXF68_08080 [Actinomadura decatromicini]
MRQLVERTGKRTLVTQANALHVSKSALGRYLQGRPISAANLEAMVAAADEQGLWRPGERDEFLAAYERTPTDQGGPADNDQDTPDTVSESDDPALASSGKPEVRDQDQAADANRPGEEPDVTRPPRTSQPAKTPEAQTRRGAVLVGLASIIAALVTALVVTAVFLHSARSSPGTAAPGHRESSTTLGAPSPSSATSSRGPSPTPSPPRTSIPALHGSGEEPSNFSPRRRPRSPASPDRPAPTADCRPNQYEVKEVGDVLNETGDVIGRVVRGDVFFREMPAKHDPRRYRYYGTVPTRNISGYVMEEKLEPSCA